MNVSKPFIALWMVGIVYLIFALNVFQDPLTYWLSGFHLGMMSIWTLELIITKGGTKKND